MPIDLDDELSEQYLAQCREHLVTIETDLLGIQDGGTEIDEALVNRVLRAVHSIQGGARFFDLVKIGELARQAENVLALIRSRELFPTPDRARVLLRATDRLHELIQSPASRQGDGADVTFALAGFPAGPRASSPGHGLSAAPPHSAGSLRTLLVEDHFASRILLSTFLSRYGECHIAVNGKEAVEAFRTALERSQKYHLICMDIMMPEMDGREAVRQIRAQEEAYGILSTYGARIIMTTAVDDVKEVIGCFQELCDAYLMKPIDLAELLGHMKQYQLVS